MRLFLIFLICTLSISFSSCEKDTETISSTIEGLWIGTYTSDSAPQEGSKYFSFIIKPGGKLIVESHPQDVQIFAYGTWTLNGNILSCDYTYPNPIQGFPIRQTATANYDQNGKLTSGVWTSIGISGSTGKFSLNEVP